MTKILFRTSGGRTKNKELGLGHVFRCMHLASVLKPNPIHFLIEDYGSVNSILIKKGFKNITNIVPGISVDDDIIKTRFEILKNNIDLLIIDRYGLSKRFVKIMKQIVKVVVISDLKNLDYNADLIVNGFIGFDNKIIKNRFLTRCLIGPRYQILNPNYSKKEKYKKKYDLLITLGGYDANNILEIIIDEIENYIHSMKIKIILGPATVKTKKVKNFEKRNKDKIEIIQTSKNFKKDIGSTKFGICAAGITSYEFSSLKVPFAIICQYPHQSITAKEWSKRKYAINLGFIQNNNQKLQILLKKLHDNTIKLNSNFLVDGLGSKRISKEILKL